MKILIDINHPAHVHYFRNFIYKMKEKGHEFIITNRDDSLINYLLDFYKINHNIRNKRPVNSKSKINSVAYLLIAFLKIFKVARGQNVDAVLGFANVPGSLYGRLIRKPVVVIDDTEHNNLNHSIYKNLASIILTPFYFNKKISKKQVYFNAYVEQFYLTHRVIAKTEKEYVFLRFISFDARHDSKVNKERLEMQRNELVSILRKKFNLIISCEGEELQKYYSEFAGDYAFHQVHDVMAGAELVITEGATMASEAGIMGVPYIYTNPLRVGYIDEQVKKFPNARQMSYEQLLRELKMDSNITFKRHYSVEALKNINPTEMLEILFSDIHNNIMLFQGNTINKNFLSQITDE